MKLLMSSQLRIPQVRNIYDILALVQHEVQHLLLVVDPASGAEPGLTVALDLAERWGTEIVLVHGGRLFGRGTSGKWTSNTAVHDLLCLSWQVMGLYRDTSISRTLPSSIDDVFQEAAQRRADLILLSEPLCATFQHQQLTTSSSNVLARCPILEVVAPERDRSEIPLEGFLAIYELSI